MNVLPGSLPSGPDLRDDAEAPALVSNGRVLLIGAVCAVFVALSVSAQSYLSMLGHGHSFWRILWWQLSTAGLWALFAPVLVRVGARLHDMSKVQRHTWALVAATGLLTIAAHIAITAQLSIWLSPFQPVVVSDFAFAVRSQFESQFATDVLVFAMLLVVGRTAAVSDRARRSALRESKLEAELARAHLEALRLEIQPHFLFNTLNSISVLMQRDPRGANEMLLSLSELLRMSLRDDSSAGIPLREELRLLHLYVGIQRIRFSDRLRFEEEIDEEALDGQVPTLFLQPLVENALRHGIEAADEPGFVRLRVAVADSRISIVIENSCPADGARPGDGTASTGIGLKNTAARLSAFFGDGHRFEAARVELGLYRVEIGFDRRAVGAALAGGKRA